MDAVGVLGKAIGEHLDLGELMDPVKSLGELAGGARFAAEAVGEAGKTQRQVLLVEDGAGIIAAKRYFGGADEAAPLALDRIDIGFRAAGVETDAFEDLGFRDIWSREKREAFLQEDVERVSYEGELEDHALVLQIIELGARDARGRVEVDDVEILTELDMVLGIELEFRGLA